MVRVDTNHGKVKEKLSWLVVTPTSKKMVRVDTNHGEIKFIDLQPP